MNTTDAEYLRLLEMNPLQPDVWRMRARIALQDQRSSDAIELLQQGLKHLPSHTSLMGDLVNIYLLLRDPVSARPLLEALRNAPDEYPEFTANYARLLWIEGDYDQALKAFKQALERNPGDQKTATRVAQAYVSLGHAEKAMEFVQSWRDRGVTAGMMAVLAVCEFDLHGIEPARAAVKTGLQMQAEHPTLNYLYAVLLTLSGELDNAQAHVARFQQTGDIHVLWTSFQFAYGRSGNISFHGLGTSLLDAALASAPSSGLVLEFGVYHGLSLRHLAQRIDGPVHGFDSFEGLPEDWKSDEPVGSYSAHGRLPLMPPQVELHPGWFKDSLPSFVAQQTENARLMHIDCDLYSSTRTVLNEVYPLLQAGSILVFDEFLGYPGYEHHEFRAWNEFAKKFGLAYEYIGFTLMARKAALRITKVA
mgnify:CR=1 FL=1